MIKPGHQKFCHITTKWNKYAFHNLRDFKRTTDWVWQKQNWIEDTFDASNITWLDIYISPFALHDMVWHTILSFIFTDGKKLLLSVEWQQNIGEAYKIRKTIYPWYRMRYIRGTEKDTIWLRLCRKEKIFKYPIYIKAKNIQELFKEFVKNTNESKNHYKPYWLVLNNCTSSLRTVARHHLPIPKRNIGFTFNKFLPKFLHKLGALKLEEKEEIKKV